jgi:hypothetical protein
LETPQVHAKEKKILAKPCPKVKNLQNPQNRAFGRDSAFFSLKAKKQNFEKNAKIDFFKLKKIRKTNDWGIKSR